MSEIPNNEKSCSISEWYSKYNKAVFYIGLVLIVGASIFWGYGIAGSGILEKVLDVSKRICDELKSIVSFQELWTEHLASVLPPVFLILAYNFHMVGKNSTLTKIGKSGLALIPMFATGALYSFLFATAGVGVGISVFGIVNFSNIFWIFALFSALIILLVIIIRKMSNDNFEDGKAKERVKKWKNKLTIVSLAIAFFIYLFSNLYVPYKTIKDYGSLFSNANECLILSNGTGT
ncbi:TPA: hypothetical protein ACPJ1O_004504 [Vibrio diabolicus]